MKYLKRTQAVALKNHMETMVMERSPVMVPLESMRITWASWPATTMLMEGVSPTVRMVQSQRKGPYKGSTAGRQKYWRGTVPSKYTTFTNLLVHQWIYFLFFHWSQDAVYNTDVILMKNLLDISLKQTN